MENITENPRGASRTAPANPRRDRKLFLWGLLAILVMAAALRLDGIGRPSFDCDELYSVRIQGITPQSAAALFGRTAFHDLHPPLAYFAFLVWTAVAGVGETAVRMLPLLWSLLAVGLIGLIGRRLGGSLAGLAAALLLAFNPFHIAYSQEARPYAQAVALSLAATLFLLRSLSEGRKRDQILYALCCALALYTHYFALLALAPHALVLIWLVLTGDEASRRAARQAMLAFACGCVTFVGWLPALAHQYIGTPGGPPRTSYLLGKSAFDNLAEALSYVRDVAGLAKPPFLFPALAAVVLLLVLGLSWKGRIPGAATGVATGPILPRWSGLVLGGIAAVAIAGLAWAAPVYLLPPARSYLLGLGYEPGSVAREVRSLHLLVLFLPGAVLGLSLLVLGWDRLSALLDRLPRLGRGGRGGAEAGRPLAVPVLLGLLLILPVALCLTLATMGAQFLSDRNLLLFLPAFCLALGLGLMQLARRPAWRLAAVPLLLALTLSGLQYQPLGHFVGRPGIELGLDNGDWRDLAQELDRRPDLARPPFVVVDAPRTDPALYYLTQEKPRRIPARGGAMSTATLGADFRFLHLVKHPESEALLADLRRVARLQPRLRFDEFVLYEVEPAAPQARQAALR